MGYTPPDSVIIGRIQREFPSDELRERVRATNTCPASLPMLPLCDHWEMEADILDDEGRPSESTFSFELDHTDGLSSHYSAQNDFDSDVERTLAQKWERATTDWELRREDDVLDLGAEVMLHDFAIEHPDGRRVIFEIAGFWTPEYFEEKLAKIRASDRDNLIVGVSERLDCSAENLRGSTTVFSDLDPAFTSMML